MALDTNQYGYLIDPLVPITDAKGTTIKDGFLRVYIAGSSTPVITYRNYDGAVNEKTIELDNSGRCKYPVIVSKSLAYKVVVYDAQHSQETPIITVDKMFAIGASVTAGAGATVVTGLDGLTTKPDGFVDASVVGTDGYVALDHTLVTDDLNTDAKVTAVEDDRYIPLLNDDVNDPDSKITLKRLKLWVHNDNVVTAGTIYPTLQDAIADADDLSVGDIFETNGFHTSGDGGASRYVVSSSGTANGMDIIQLSAGKLAILQIDNGTGTPEQFGYDRWNQDDLTPVMNRMQTAHIRNIILSPLESGDNFPYLMKTTFTPGPAVRISSKFDFNTGASGRIWFVPSSYGTNNTPMFQLTNRGFGIKDVVLMNRPWFTEGDKHNCVCFRMAISGTGNMWYDFESLAIQGFDVGILHENVTGQDSSGLIWHCTFKKLQMALNNVSVYLRNVNYLTKFENCFFTCNDSGARSIVLEETFSTEFERCNFGIYNPATTIVDFTDYIVTGKAVDRRFTQAKFTNCNFEIESDNSHPLPTSAKGFFMRFGDHDEFTVELDNCCFIITPLVRSNIYGCRPIQLGAKTRFKITNSSGPYADVNYSGNEFYGWDYCKRMFDETKPPLKEVGSLIIQHCVGIIPPPNNMWGSVYLPTVKTDDMTCPQSDNDTDFAENYPDAKDGILLLNLDKANIEAKVGPSIVQVTSPASGKVRIGDRIYDYVTIDGRKWITTNLQLWTMNTRQWHFPNHEEFGFYYGVETFAEVDALLPAGWRRPNYADCQSIISQGYAAVQALGQTAFPNATNTTGLSILPCYRWMKPNTSVTFNRGFFWGPEESGVGWHAVDVQASNMSYAGWGYSNVPELKIPLRVCADA